MNYAMFFRFYYLFLLFCLPSLLFSQSVKSKKVETIDGKSFYIHTVKKGETLYAISKAYETTVNDIVLDNPDVIDGISPMQEIKIAVKSKTKQASEKSFIDSTLFIFHKVESKQTIYSISKQYTISADTINRLNKDVLKEGLKIGQTLKIPRSKNSILSQEKTTSNNAILSQYTSVIKKNSIQPIQNQNIKDSFLPEYQIALLLPFGKDGNDENQLTNDSSQQFVTNENKLNSRVKNSIDFLNGLSLAFDSIEKTGFKCKLHVYNLNEDDSIETEKIIAGDSLSRVNLIIGPFNQIQFTKFAEYAKKKIYSNHITHHCTKQNSSRQPLCYKS